MTTSASQIFNFLRGAVKSSFGVEDFRGKRIAFIGMNIIGQELLSMLCFDDVKLFFSDFSIVNYSRAHMICNSINVISTEIVKDIDILINLEDDFLGVSNASYSKEFPLSEIGDDPYNQGIHEYYL